jgi:hypothetical protein
MKCFVVCEGQIYFAPSISGADTALPDLPESAVADSIQDLLCVTQQGEKIPLVHLNVLPAGLAPFNNEMHLTDDAWWAMRVFLIKSRLVTIANHLKGVNQSSVFRILGILEPIFLVQRITIK